MELLLPKPICSLVNCDDLENLDAESALAEMRKEQEVFILLPDVYAYRYDFRRLSPSVINDFEYCPRLLWVQYKLGLSSLLRTPPSRWSVGGCCTSGMRGLSPFLATS